MTATSARRQKLWASAAAQCTAVCKNTAWNEVAQLRTAHSAPGRRGGSAGLGHCIDSAVDRRLFLPHHLDFGAADCRALAGVRDFCAKPSYVFSADTLES